MQKSSEILKKSITKKLFVERIIILLSSKKWDEKWIAILTLLWLVKNIEEKQKIDYPIDTILVNKKEFNKLKKEVSIVSGAFEGRNRGLGDYRFGERNSKV